MASRLYVKSCPQCKDGAVRVNVDSRWRESYCLTCPWYRAEEIPLRISAVAMGGRTFEVQYFECLLSGCDERYEAVRAGYCSDECRKEAARLRRHAKREARRTELGRTICATPSCDASLSGYNVSRTYCDDCQPASVSVLLACSCGNMFLTRQRNRRLCETCRTVSTATKEDES